jgi:HK97 family phage portal protein
MQILPGSGTVQTRMSAVVPSPWDGWVSGWQTPNWGTLGPRYDELVDTAWAALDLNASVLSAMPVYRTRNQTVLDPTSWMTNPDPSIYSSWAEFAKQLFWEWQLGEVFLLPMARGADGFPFNFRVIPQALIKVEMGAGIREYRLGNVDVTGDILHIRYKSSTDQPHGTGPLESGKYRLVAAGVLARYVSEFAEGGWIPQYILETDKQMTADQSKTLLDQWWAQRMKAVGDKWRPAVAVNGLKAHVLQVSPADMLETAKFTEARIANLLGVHPFLLALPTESSMTYSNASSLFDFHDRRYLKTAATHVMSALSNWVLPRGQSVELNRDEYSRPPLAERAEAYSKLIPLQVLSPEEARVMERFMGGPVAAEALTGGGRS